MLSPQQHKLCAYRNPAKSVMYVNEQGKISNKLGLDYCEFDQAYVDTNGSCSAGNDIKDLVEIFCPNCKRKMCHFKVVPGNDISDVDAIVDFRYTEALASYRDVRPDKVLGLECMCGHFDTRLSTREKLRNPGAFPKYVPHSSTEKSKFGSASCKLKVKMLKDRNAIKDRKKHGRIKRARLSGKI